MQHDLSLKEKHQKIKKSIFLVITHSFKRKRKNTIWCVIYLKNNTQFEMFIERIGLYVKQPIKDVIDSLWIRIVRISILIKYKANVFLFLLEAGEEKLFTKSPFSPDDWLMVSKLVIFYFHSRSLHERQKYLYEKFSFCNREGIDKYVT